MAAPPVLPCEPFTSQAEIELCCTYPIDFQTIDPALLALGIESASQVIWAATGRQFGICEAEVHVCRENCACAPPGGYGSRLYAYGQPYPVNTTDGWINCHGQPRGCGPQCGIRPCETVALFPSPVAEIVDVTIDGSTFPAGDYRVDDWIDLVRTDGDCWPDEFDVTFRFGHDVPTVVRRAASVLACELIYACLGGQCKLPSRVQTITREGLTLGLLDDFDVLWERGGTGIFDIDLAIRTYNPFGRTSPTKVLSPDLPNHTGRYTIRGT